MRPKSLADVARLTIKGESFDLSFADFLDEFYHSPNDAALQEVPPLLAEHDPEIGRIEDAYLAAAAEELARKYALSVPTWTAGEARVLHQPWFASSMAALRAVLILESPPSFRARNLFVSENALSRA